MVDVSIAACADYSPENVRAALAAAIEPVGGLDWVTPGMNIAVKANLMMTKRPEQAATTHPEVLKALCELLRERGASVVVGDSPGGLFTAPFLAAVYSATGVRCIEETGAKLNDDFTHIEVEHPDAVAARSFHAVNFLCKADAVIDASKLKTHGLMAYTGACKNFYGSVPGMLKSEYHYLYGGTDRFADMLVDLCEWFAPRLSIEDAVMGMEGNGPSGGEPRFIGAILAAKNPHALDLAAAHIIGLGCADVPTLAAANRRGLIPDSYDKLTFAGDIESFAVPDYKLVPSLSDSRLWGYKNPAVAAALERLFARRPNVTAEKCVGCGACAKCCPREAITVSPKGRAVIDRGKCIRCFCCQEFCPQSAISVRRTLVARTLTKQD